MVSILFGSGFKEISLWFAECYAACFFLHETQPFCGLVLLILGSTHSSTGSSKHHLECVFFRILK